VKSSKAEIQAKYHKIPMIRFKDQKLTSFLGLLIFQVLFRQLHLRERLKKVRFPPRPNYENADKGLQGSTCGT
jgi:hypothetical protein